MRLPRPYVIALIAAALLGLTYTMVTNLEGAHAQAAARREAQETVALSAESKAYYARANLVLARVHMPREFTHSQPATCGGVGTSRCFLSPRTPRKALKAAVAALKPLGVALNKNACDDPAKLPPHFRAAVGRTWAPCSASGRLNGLDGASVIAFPMIDRAHSTKRHVVFSGTHVTVAFIDPHF